MSREDASHLPDAFKECLFEAAQTGRVDVVAGVLQGARDGHFGDRFVNNSECVNGIMRALHVAAINNFPDVIALLMEAWEGDMAREWVPLMDTEKLLRHAANHGSCAAAACLIQAGASVNGPCEYPETPGPRREFMDRSPLQTAARGAHVDMVALLVGAGAQVDELHPRNGATALHYAVWSRSEEIARLLLQVKADPNCRVTRPNGFVGGVLKFEGVTPLYGAANLGCCPVVVALVEHKADPNLALPAGSTPLVVAAEKGHVAVLRVLLGAKADVDKAVPVTGATPLCCAAASGQTAAVELLVHAKAAVNNAVCCYDVEGTTPLVLAVKCGHAGAVRALLCAKADANLAPVRGRPPLVSACHTGDAASVEALVAAKADLNRGCADGTTAMSAAAGLGHVGALQVLVGAKADVGAVPRARGWNAVAPMVVAASAGNTPVVRILLDAKADGEDFPGDMHTPLGAAAANGRTDTVRVLAALKVDVNRARTGGAFEGATPLCLAAERGYLSTVRALLEAKADAGAGAPETPLVLATRRGDVPVLSALVAAKADLERISGCGATGAGICGATYAGICGPSTGACVPTEGGTPLFLAAAGASSMTLKALLAAKANVDWRRSSDGATALVEVVRHGHVELARTLLDAKADVNLPGTSPLAAAAGSEYVDTMRLLLQAGADVNHACGRTGLAALHDAALRCHVRAARMLVKFKADVDLPARVCGATPLHLAARQGYSRMIRALIRAKACVDRAAAVSGLLRGACAGVLAGVPHASVTAAQVAACATHDNAARILTSAAQGASVAQGASAAPGDMSTSLGECAGEGGGAPRKRLKVPVRTQRT